MLALGNIAFAYSCAPVSSSNVQAVPSRQNATSVLQATCNADGVVHAETAVVCKQAWEHAGSMPRASLHEQYYINVHDVMSHESPCIAILPLKHVIAIVQGVNPVLTGCCVCCRFLHSDRDRSTPHAAVARHASCPAKCMCSNLWQMLARFCTHRLVQMACTSTLPLLTTWPWTDPQAQASL